MRYIYLIFFLLYMPHTWAQGTGTIQGIVKTADGNAAEYVHVSLEGTSKGAIASKSGQYTITNVAPGSYTVVASFVGLKQQKMSVEVKAGATTQADFMLNENSEELQEIIISAGRYPTESIYASKMPLESIENPQVYNAIDSRLLKEQVVTNFSDALKNAPGVEKLWESTGRGGDGGGYYSMRGFSVQPTMVNGLPGLTNGSLDPVNIERIEVLKGPVGTLFGSSLVSYGGLINTVTKKPYERFGGEITYTAGSFGLNRVTADINTPVDAEKNVLVRVNTAYHTENSFQDAGFRKTFVFAPTLAYQATDRLSFLVMTEFMQAEGTNPTMLFLDRAAPLTKPNMDEIGYGSKRSYTSNNLTIKNPTANLQAQMNYKLSDRWTSQTLLQRGTSQSKGYYSYLYEQSRFYPIDGMVFGRYVSDQNTTTSTTDIQQNFIGDFDLGSVARNRIVVGLDYYKSRITDNSTDYAGNGVVYIGRADRQNVYDVVFGGKTTASYDNGVLSEQGMAALLDSSGVANSVSEVQVASAYFSDVIEFKSVGLSAMVGLRLDRFNTEGDISTDEDDYKQTALSPKVGIVYQPWRDQLSVFANYANGFANVAPQRVADANGANARLQSFEPERANQVEVGIKTNLIKNKLTSTISYYDIKVSNRVMTDPDNVNNSIQGGEVESKGVEVDVNSSPVKGLDVNVGYSDNRSTVIKGSPGQLWAVVGRRPSEAGPERLFNAWATYRFTQGSLKGFGVGFGSNAASKRFIMDSEVVGTFALPAYTIYNASVFYRNEKFAMTLKVDNLTDVTYFKGWSTINPQRPRAVTANFAYTF